MAKKPPDPSRQSAGGAADAGGGNFQARAAAWWLGHVLLRLHGRGVPYSFPHATRPVRVAAQTGDATDDLRVSFDRGEQLFAQCKTSLSIPEDVRAAAGGKNAFVSAWIQFYRQIASAKETDSIALVLAVTKASEPINDLRQVLERFRHAPAETAFDDPAVAVTKTQRVVAQKIIDLFAALAKEPDLADFAQHQDRLLRCASVQVWQVRDDGRDWMYLDALLQAVALVDPSDAPLTLKTLSDLGHALHEGRGSRDEVGVRKAMTDLEIALKDAPDLRPEWEALESRSKVARDGVFDTLGGKWRIKRAEEVELLRAALREHRCAVVTGPSGSGKSVVVKDWAHGGGAGAERIVWLSGAELDDLGPSRLRQELGLTMAPEVLFQTETRPTCLVIDGVDRCFTRDGLACLRQLLEAARLGDLESGWRLVLTCDELEWARVARAFQAERINLPSTATLRIGPVDVAEIAPLLKQFPALGRLLGQRDVWSVFDNLKILDLVVTRLESGAPVDAGGWVSEWQVADWWWQKEIADGSESVSRIAAVLDLATKQGDDSRASIALTELSGPAQEAANALRESGCWKLVPASRVDFAHDLFGDWSRHQVLRTETAGREGLHNFLLKRASLPLWHRAIWLHAAQLLETESGVVEWHRLFQSVADGSTEGVLAGDVLLEGIVFSSRLDAVLEKLWPVLSADDGNLLRRLLDRFLHAASTPDPEVRRHYGSQPELQTLASAYHRYPMWGRWVPLVQFLAPHAVSVAEAASLEVAKMAELWFRRTEKGMPGRMEMGALAVAAAERCSYQDEDDQSWREEPRVARVYGAALQAFAEHPERVRELALQLSGRKERRKKPKEERRVPVSQRWRRPSWWQRKLRALKKLLRVPLTEREESDAMIEAYSSIGTTYIGPSRDTWRKARPWPDGPRFEVSKEFQGAFFKTDACVAMIAEAPELAREILLATLIEEPQYVTPHSGFGYSSLDEHAGLTHETLTEAPFYDEGPFLAFLRAQPVVGLDALIAFVNFASVRWAREIRRKSKSDAPGVQVQIDGKLRKWRGDWRLYYGYRGAPWINPALICALMALERWLHERLADDEDISPAVTTLLERSRSVGIAGLLVSVGKRDHERFLNILNPLIGVPEFYVWEDGHNAQFLDGPALEWGASEAKRKWRLKWARLSFRRRALLNICQELFARSANARRQFDGLTARWKVRLQTLPGQDRVRAFLPELIEFFDPARWNPGHDELGDERWIYSPPSPPADAETSGSSDNATDGTGSRDVVYVFDLLDKCFRCLEGQDETFAANPGDLWDMLNQLTHAASQGGASNLPPVYAVSAFALMAVLLVKCRDWLHAHPDAEEFCRQSVLRVPFPAQLPTADQQALAGDKTALVFYAAALAALWAESPASMELRHRVASLAAVGTDAEVAALCRQAFRFRTALGGSFLELQSFVVHAAGERSRHSYIRALRDQPERFANWLSRTADTFAAGNELKFPANWSRVRHKQFPMPHSHRTPYSRSTERKHYGLDFECLVAAFSWIPALDQAQSPDERQHWIGVRLRLLEAFQVTFPPHQGRDDHYEGQPYRAEYELLASTAQTLLQLRPEEGPDRFWKLLFGLGTSAQHWVEEFVKDFLLAASEASPVPHRLVPLWGEMLDFASSSTAWEREPTRGSLDRERLWRCVLAINPLFEGLWEKHGSELLPLWPKIFGLIEAKLRDGESLAELCRFLRQPFAAGFLSEGLVFLERLCTSNPDGVFDRHDLEDTVARFLLTVRATPPISGNSAGQAATAYRTLVALLATRRNALAIQLQREHGRTL
jgi:hypothetical protein